RLGGQVVSSVPQYGTIRAWIPLDQLETLAAAPEITRVEQATEPRVHKVTTSEGDIAHRAAQSRTGFGINGTGVKIGVISDSVDGLATAQSTGGVGPVTVLSGSSGGSGEGTAMLEIVYDLAPGAALFFATGKGGEAAMASNIQALRTAGCDVIVDDMGYLTEPVFQDGRIAQAVNTVSADGALYFSAA